MTERTDLITALDRHRGFLLQTAMNLTEDQARAASTVSALTVASILKHVADTEEQWMAFAAKGAEAFGGAGAYESDVDWDAVAAGAATETGGEGESGWIDDRFTLTDADTLEALRARVGKVAAATASFIETADLDVARPLPEAPWFEQGATWSVRRVVLHVLAEISQHSGHADIIRETIDGARTMG